MQSRKNKDKTSSPRQSAIKFIQDANEFEKSKLVAIKRNNKIAWGITGVSTLMTVMSVAAVMLLTPLKTVEPFVIRVDNNTGFTDIVTTIKDQNQSYGEVTDRYWLTQYVKHRESYDWWTVQSNYDAAMLLSGGTEQDAISTLFQSEGAPYKVFKDDFRVDVKILSVTWIGDVAQIRFEKQVKPLSESVQRPPAQRLMATIGYQYLNTPQSEKDREINPLGFQVMHYRVDTES